MRFGTQERGTKRNRDEGLGRGQKYKGKTEKAVRMC